MRKKEQSFGLITRDYMTKFTNNTDFSCWISFKPIPPKRKHHKFMHVGAGKFVFIEEDIDLKSISITFEEPATAFEDT